MSKISLGIYGYFHFFEDLNECINTIKSININYFGIGMGKFIILHDQISMKDGKLLGKKGEYSYIFTSVYSNKKVFEKVLEDGVIKKENCINSLDIDRNEFDKFNNLKKATTLNSLREFIKYVKENDLK